MFLTPIWNGFLNRKTFLFQLSRLCDLIPFLVIFILAQPCVTNAQIDRTVSELETKSVILTCPVNEAKCGKLHSLNWFKGEDRIAAMLLGETNVMNVNEKYQNRVTVVLNPYRLIINDLQIGDEDIYLCDTTFFIPEESCDNFNGYRIELRVLVPPSEVIILDAKGDRIENGNTVGPMQERQSLKATCTVKNTRPQPEVGWFRGSKRLTTYSPTHDIKDGLFTSTLELDWSLSREDLAQEIECRVKSAAMPETIVKKFSINLQVRPTSIEMNGVEHHTVQGSKVILTCDIHGARPPVNLTWYNVTTPITTEENILTEIRTKAFEKNDGTYHTQSELIFNATRFENDRVFRCEAENIVIQINREKPISSALTLEVLYPPVVKVSPPEVVTNTSEIVLLNCEYVANPASLTNVVWYRNNEVVNVNNTDRYQGGNSENVALVIKSTEKDDTGNYSCQLSNSIGKGVSEQEINLDVQYVPIVEVVMIPEGPVKESDESNVTLFCNIIGANPSLLTKVRWYANSTLLKELPDCEETNEDLCHIDPSKLLLESIGRGFFYNYSCEGLNAAGWGPRSEDKELMVHYEPGPASLSNFPLIAVKKKSVVLTCSVDDPGYPDSNRYRWLRGGRGPLQDVVTKDWTVEPVGLDSRTNYSCYAYNEGGRGIMATVNLKVHAPPFFIKNLPPYTGILHSSTNANLTCRIECVPRCEISWLKGGIPIEKNNTKYFVKEKYMESSPATGDFESMLSVLHFNMSNWPQQKFDIEADNDNYTCLSTSNSVGPSVKSSTYFSIEYSPINTTVSEENVYIEEDTKPERIFCNARANPEPSYKWIFKNETIANGNFLTFDFGLRRNQNGIYSCMAYNKHGNDLAHTVITVQFKPDCNIKRENINGQDTLVCTAFGKPSEADFSWSIKGENETIENLGSGYPNDLSDKSFYVLKADYGITRTYRCLANNTVGSGTFCEIEVDEQLAWWQRWEENTLVILLTGILVLLLIVVIICCIIIYVCRRRRRQDKLHDKSSSMGEPLTEPCEYENLPFHGLQTAPNKPLNATSFEDEFIYADLESQHYGPINYKAASLYAKVKKNKITGVLDENK
ncbi:B-cell receptor CD22 isoform X19 [Drosophila bipectinata]|uniref:B-cell receptor CD22 isoform X19 n=1 Tax=Drosophila bipectinata TaxID=42026 RepID=UPI001C89FEF1|nr:hemicentin-1 isoform X13 [Drosophila bipectinata]